MRRKKELPPHRVLLPAGASRAEAILENLRDRLAFDRDADEVLDCGCGTGRLALLLSPWVRRITAVEEAPGLAAELKRDLANARQRNIRILNLELMDAARQLPPATFDLALAVMVCHHIPQPEKFLLGLKSLLKPDGILCIIDLQEEDGSFHTGDVTVPHPGFKPEDMRRLLAECGFFNMTEIPIQGISRPGVLEPRDYPLFMVLADNAPPSLRTRVAGEFDV